MAARDADGGRRRRGVDCGEWSWLVQEGGCRLVEGARIAATTTPTTTKKAAVADALGLEHHTDTSAQESHHVEAISEFKGSDNRGALVAQVPLSAIFSLPAVTSTHVGSCPGGTRPDCDSDTEQANHQEDASCTCICAVIRSLLSDANLNLTDVQDVAMATAVVLHASTPQPMGSQWHKYFASLPRNHVTTVSFDPAVLQLLQGTNLHHATVERRTMIGERARTVHRWLNVNWRQHAAAFSYQRYVWATEMLSSRAFTSKLLEPGSVIQPRDGASALDAPTTTTAAVSASPLCAEADEAEAALPSSPSPTQPPLPACMVPLFDMFDHNPSADVTWRTTETHVELWTREAIAPGQQIYSNYGCKSNEELMLAYGFALPDNAHNEFHLVLGVAPSIASGRGAGPVLKMLSSLGTLSPRGLKLSLVQSDISQSTTRLLQALALVMQGTPYPFSPPGATATTMGENDGALAAAEVCGRTAAPEQRKETDTEADACASSKLSDGMKDAAGEDADVGLRSLGGALTGEAAFAARAVLQQAAEVLTAKAQQHTALLRACEDFAQSLAPRDDSASEASPASHAIRTAAAAAADAHAEEAAEDNSESDGNSSSSGGSGGNSGNSDSSSGSNGKLMMQVEMVRRFLKGQCGVLQAALEHIDHVHVVALGMQARPPLCLGRQQQQQQQQQPGRQHRHRRAVQRADGTAFVHVLTLDALARHIPDAAVILGNVQGLEPELAFALCLLACMDKSDTTALALAPFTPCVPGAAVSSRGNRGGGEATAHSRAFDDDHNSNKRHEDREEGEEVPQPTKRAKRDQTAVETAEEASGSACAAAMAQMHSDDEAVLEDLAPLISHMQHLYPAGIAPSAWRAALSCVRSRLVDMHGDSRGNKGALGDGVVPALLPRNSGVQLWAAGNVRLQAIEGAVAPESEDGLGLERAALVALAPMSAHVQMDSSRPVLGVPLSLLKSADPQLWPALQRLYCSHACQA